MGVNGLQSFLKKNGQHLADRRDLSNCSLVIDANNILYLLYTKCTIDQCSEYYRNDVYGGDLINYGLVVTEFFTNLQKCNIKSVLIFDGSVIGKSIDNASIAVKENETLRRGVEKFNRAKDLRENSTGDEVIFSPAIKNVFRNIAATFKIEVIQAPYEADTHIARVANELNCNVLTNDSDFFIYSLKKGFILLDSFDYKKPIVDELGKSSIRCTIFSQDKLTRSIRGFDVDNLPLMSALLGNDYVHRDLFAPVVRSVGNGSYNSLFETESFNHRKIANMLFWLSGKTLNESIDMILRDFVPKPEHRPMVEEKIRSFFENYRIEAVDEFPTELKQIYSPDTVPEGYSGISPVNYLKTQMEREDLGFIALDMIFRNTSYLRSILDDFTLKPSSSVCLRPYSLALTLLRPRPDESIPFQMYGRVDQEYARFTVIPMKTLENYGSIEHLSCYSLITLEPSKKRSLLMACFRFSEEELKSITDIVSEVLSGPFVYQASLCFLLVKYVGRETKLAPKPQFVNALMLTLFYYAALSNNLNMQSIPDDNAYGQLLLRLRPHTITNNKRDYGNRDHSLFRRIMHFINQLQATFKSHAFINGLLDHPFQSPKPEIFFNSVLIYSLTKLLLLSEETIESLCEDLPILAEVCESIFDLVR